MSAPNRNTLWAEIIVDELARSGLETVCIAPGSRSTPLTVEFAQHPDIRVYSHLDERSAAFFALGASKTTGKPSAVLCTSGTATANFFPAIIEARQSQIPLLILTTDRPPELRDSGANQTIDQIKMYGDQVLWSVDVALPEAKPNATTIRYLRTLPCRAVARTQGIPNGVVHLNFPFRKPLEPVWVEEDDTELPKATLPRENGLPFTGFTPNTIQPDAVAISRIATIIQQHEKGLIVCGGMSCDTSLAHGIAELSRLSGYPVLAEPTSGMRFGAHVEEATILAGYDNYLRQESFGNADVILRFGKTPTSKAINDYLVATSPNYFVQISESGVWSDDLHLTSEFVHGNPLLVCRDLCVKLEPRIASSWESNFRVAEEVCAEILGTLGKKRFFDGTVVQTVVEHMPENGTVFVANSLPVRELEQFVPAITKQVRVLANRGASGIDGTISSALGAQAVTNEPLVLITGDLSFYHDLNGLLAVQRCNVPILVVLINNNGGGIFRRLPIAQFDPPFTDLFLTPHELEFQQTIEMYGLEYKQASSNADVARAVQDYSEKRQPCVVEVRTDSQEDEQHRQAIMKLIRDAIALEI